jgi:hypothetical protein
MKAKDLIRALKVIDPEAEILINVMQSNKVYGVVQLPIDYGTGEAKPGLEDDKYDQYYNMWVNSSYGGSITVYLPGNAYIAKLPKE